MAPRRRTATPAPATAPAAENLLLPVDVPAAAPDDQRLWSVTTIINALDRPALLYWAAEQAAEWAITHAKELQDPDAFVLHGRDGDERGRAALVKWIRDARFKRPPGQRSATELGTAVHDAVEAYALTGERPEVDDEVRPYLDQFDRWAQRFSPRYVAAEMTVFSPTWGYAGTLDAIADVCGMRLLLDYKSSRKSWDDKGAMTTPYPEASLQLAAYRHAELAAVWRPRRTEVMRRRYYLLGATERGHAVPVPTVDGGAVLHITPDHCTAYPARCGRAEHEAFLYVLEAARWVFETSKSVFGPPLVAPPVRAAS